MEKVLVVDDEPMIRSMMGAALSTFGYSVTGAGTVGEAIGLLAGERMDYDALVTDYNLEDGTGFEILRTVKSRNSNTPVILMSGSLKLDPEASLESGFSAYFQKPFSCMEVGKELNTLLSKRSVSEISIT